MSLKFTVGDLTIHRIIEQETTFLPAQEMLPGLTPEVLAENRAWMQKAGALDDKDVLILCFQSYVVKTPHHTILIDSCIGNDKPRPQRPKWNMKIDDTYARALAAAGPRRSAARCRRRPARGPWRSARSSSRTRPCRTRSARSGRSAPSGRFPAACSSQHDRHADACT